MTSVRREIVLPVPRERAWELLTEPRELEEWLADDVELEPEPGGELRATWDGGEERTGVVEDVVPERCVRFRWWQAGADYSRVEWTLDDHPDGTRLTVVERRLAPAAPRAIASARAGVLPPGPLMAWGPRLRALRAACVLCPA